MNLKIHSKSNSSNLKKIVAGEKEKRKGVRWRRWGRRRREVSAVTED